MKHIHHMMKSKAVGFNFDDKTGDLTMAMEYESVAADVLKMKLAAIYVGSYSINYEKTDMDFAIKHFEDIQDVFAYLNSALVDHVSMTNIEEVNNPEEYWFEVNPCYYINNKTFNLRLAFVFIMPDLQREENELCYVKLTLDIIESNFEFFE